MIHPNGQNTCVYNIETDAEKALPPARGVEDSWQKQTTLWLLVFALLLWLVTYTIVVTATLFFKTVDSFNANFGGVLANGMYNVSAMIYKDTLMFSF